MTFGCIGEHLSHSFSCEIHKKIGAYDYKLKELAPDELDAFMRNRDFLGINVTIPYKQSVIPYCDELDDKARAIGAVNTIVNRDGRLYGYNTDFEGLRSLAERAGLSLKDRKVLILGTGGTSRTASAVAAAGGAREIIRVSRKAQPGAVSYEQAEQLHNDASVIINCTPCGMFPKADAMPIHPELFPHLEGVLDAIYNPLRSDLIQKAASMHKKAEGGLYMLVRQAVAAAEHFMGRPMKDGLTERIYRELLGEKQNIVLIGMPCSGKSTIGRFLAAQTGRQLVDTDTEIEKQAGMRIPEIFEKYGETYFRNLETKVIHEISTQGSLIIATGGGAVLRQENVHYLRRMGRLYFLDRPPELLIPSSSRPLAASPEAIRKRYRERYGIYCAAADEIIPNKADSYTAAADIRRRHFE